MSDPASAVFTEQVICPLLSLALLAVFSLIGWPLVPRSLLPGPAMLRLAIVLASGAIFAACLAMAITCQRWVYALIAPIAQVAIAVVFHHRPAAKYGREAWSWRDIGLVTFIVLLAAWFFQAPHQIAFADGSVRKLDTHVDLGFYAQLVRWLPDAKVANGWTAVFAGQTAQAVDTPDLWYHWGTIYLGIALRWFIDLPSVNAIAHVVCPAFSVIQILAASAAAGAVCPRLSPVQRVLVGAGSLVSEQWLCSAETMQWIKDLTGFRHISHMRFPLAMAFSYKCQGTLGLCAIAAWLQQRRLVAALMLACAAVEAPHIVASVGIGAGSMMLLGMMSRDRPSASTGLGIVTLLLGTWAAVKLAGGSFPKSEGQALFSITTATIMESVRNGALDLALAALLGLVTLPGLVHLIRARDAEATPEMRSLGWIALLAGFAAMVALQLMLANPDSFHISTLAQSLIIMPAGLWGLVRLVAVDTRQRRPFWIMLATVSVIMGLPAVLAPVRMDKPERWTMTDIGKVRDALHGEPFGYISSKDRRWWLPKHAFLAALLDSRCIRLNPLKDRTRLSEFYGESAPYRLTPRLPDETEDAWMQRFMTTLGISHLIETPDDPLPEAWKKRCHLILESGGLVLYKAAE